MGFDVGVERVVTDWVHGTGAVAPFGATLDLMPGMVWW